MKADTKNRVRKRRNETIFAMISRSIRRHRREENYRLLSNNSKSHEKKEGHEKKKRPEKKEGHEEQKRPQTNEGHGQKIEMKKRPEKKEKHGRKGKHGKKEKNEKKKKHPCYLAVKTKSKRKKSKKSKKPKKIHKVKVDLPSGPESEESMVDPPLGPKADKLPFDPPSGQEYDKKRQILKMMFGRKPKAAPMEDQSPSKDEKKHQQHLDEAIPKSKGSHRFKDKNMMAAPSKITSSCETRRIQLESDNVNLSTFKEKDKVTFEPSSSSKSYEPMFDSPSSSESEKSMVDPPLGPKADKLPFDPPSGPEYDKKRQVLKMIFGRKPKAAPMEDQSTSKDKKCHQDLDKSTPTSKGSHGFKDKKMAASSKIALSCETKRVRLVSDNVNLSTFKDTSSKKHGPSTSKKDAADQEQEKATVVLESSDVDSTYFPVCLKCHVPLNCPHDITKHEAKPASSKKHRKKHHKKHH